MISHTDSSAIFADARADAPVAPGKTRICISGMNKISPNVGHAKKLADAIVKAFPEEFESYYHTVNMSLGTHYAVCEAVFEASNGPAGSGSEKSKKRVAEMKDIRAKVNKRGWSAPLVWRHAAPSCARRQ